MCKKLIIFGNTNAALVVYMNIQKDTNDQVAAFTVDKEFLNQDNYLNLPLVAFEEIEKYYSPDDYHMLIAIGYVRNNKLRADKYEMAIRKGYSLYTFVHSRAMVFNNTMIGKNCYIGANVVIHPEVVIGDDVIIRENCFIGHHTHIKDHCFVSAGTVIAGEVTVNQFCFLGANSTIKDNLTIAQQCVIGAGVTMLNSTNEKEVYFSNTNQKFPFNSDDLKNI
jgi:sugar O-acyltransferase (sialic acid O-acetyltransferase NeuD family)